MSQLPREIWISHDSVEPWDEAGQWAQYFERAQQILGAPMTHLDDKDPVRRKVVDLVEASSFICDFKAREDSRLLFGKFKGGVSFSIQLYRNLGGFCNTLKWYIPCLFIETSGNEPKLRDLFDLGNRSLKPFYAFADDLSYIVSKKKSSGAVNIERELLGIFWLTYFNSSYVQFFGKEKFNDLQGILYGSDGSITIALGYSPDLVTAELREQLAIKLGRQSFVDPKDVLSKPLGRFVLTFQQLRETATKNASK
jgi:hypothetical protein